MAIHWCSRSESRAGKGNLELFSTRKSQQGNQLDDEQWGFPGREREASGLQRDAPNVLDK